MNGYPDPPEHWTRLIQRDDPPPASVEADPAWFDCETGPATGLSIVALTVAATLIGVAGLAITAWLAFG